VSVSSSLPTPFPCWFEFLPPALHWLRKPDQTRTESKGRLSLPCCLFQTQKNQSLAGVTRGRSKQEGLGWLSCLRTAQLPWRTPRRDGLHLCSELLEYGWPGGEGCWWLREPAAEQHFGSGLSAASSAEPGRLPPRPVSSPVRQPARSALERFQCRIDVPPQGTNSQVHSQFSPPPICGYLGCHALAATAVEELQTQRAPGLGEKLLTLMMFLESCS
jgi:hypothetical protein